MMIRTTSITMTLNDANSSVFISIGEYCVEVKTMILIIITVSYNPPASNCNIHYAQHNLFLMYNEIWLVDLLVPTKSQTYLQFSQPTRRS